MVRKGNVREDLPVVIDVERRPAAVLGLHGEQPVERPLPRGRLRARVRGAHVRKRQHHHGGVVDIRIPVVLKFESPAGRLSVRPLDGPVAVAADLAVQQPVGRARAARTRR